MAQNILEEAFETVSALGFKINHLTTDPEGKLKVAALVSHDKEILLNDIIDGACDTIYVATGAMVGCGVPDMMHLIEVCQANERKFPGGKATINPETGKYLKPEGWTGPDHMKVRQLHWLKSKQTPNGCPANLNAVGKVLAQDMIDIQAKNQEKQSEGK